MINIKSLTIVTISTILFGVLSKWLIGVPYMAWGYFDKVFIASFLLWWVYISGLFYSAYQLNDEEQKKKAIIKSVIYGSLVTLVRIGIDTVIDLSVRQQPNILILAMVMEFSMILYIAGLDCFLFLKIGKRKIKEEKSGIYALGMALGSLVVVYAGLMLYYKSQVDYAVETFGSMSEVQKIGLDNAIRNLTTILGQRSTMFGTIVYVGCFVIIWCIMDKVTVKKEIRVS